MTGVERQVVDICWRWQERLENSVVGGFQTLARSGGLFYARSWSAQPGLPVLKRNELDPPVAPLLEIKGQLVSAEAIENFLLRHPAFAGHLHAAPMGDARSPPAWVATLDLPPTHRHIRMFVLVRSSHDRLRIRLNYLPFVSRPKSLRVRHPNWAIC